MKIIWRPEKIRGLRLALDLTQAEFAHRLGVSLNTVSRWECGKSKPSKLARVKLLEAEAKLEELEREEAKLVEQLEKAKLLEQVKANPG